MQRLRLGLLTERLVIELSEAHFARPRAFNSLQGNVLQVLVRDNNVDQAMRVLKKKLQKEGVFRELKRRRHYEKPSERAAREKGDAIRRARKLARKQLIREGLLPALKKRLPDARVGAKPKPLDPTPS